MFDQISFIDGGLHPYISQMITKQIEMGRGNSARSVPLCNSTNGARDNDLKRV